MSAPRLGIGRKTAYSFGNFGKSVVWSTLECFFLFFMTELWGIPPGQAGLVILITLLWDGISDPIFGFWIERTRTRLGRYGPYLIFGPPVCAVSFVLMFIQPGWSPSVMVWYAAASGLLFRTFYSICDVPHNALMVRISIDSRDATLISGLRYFFSAAGALTVSLAVAALFSADGTGQQRHFLQLAMACGGLYALSLWMSWFAVRSIDIGDRDGCVPLHLNQAIKTIVANRQFLLFLLLALVQAASVPIFAKCIAYYAKYFVGDQSWTGLALATFTLVQALSMPFWTFLAHRYNKRMAIFLAYGVMTIGLCGFAAASLLVGAELVALAVVGIATGGINMIMWAFLPDIISQGALMTGRRIEALSTSLFLLVTKAGAGLSAAFTGLAFSLAGFMSSVPQPGQFSYLLIVTMCALPLFGIGFCAVIASRIRIHHCDYGALRTDRSMRDGSTSVNL